MCEYSSYEPLAEVYISVSDNYSEDIYCLCSRVVIRGNYLEQDDLVGVGCQPQLENNIEENVVRFFNSSTESPPPQIKAIRKKENDEALSCYCSASHCSTDEHDSVRESALHSDSGADLSESSRDLDWEKYWATHGERLVWESWLAKYGSYIDPNYLSAQDACSEDTLFNIAPGLEPSKKISFSGVLDSINEINESGSVENVQLDFRDYNSSEVAQVTNNQLEDNFHAFLDIPDRLFRSDSSSLGEDELIRLSFSSSGKSSSPTATTDSMTSVTHMTISSSELSFGIEESSVKSSSIFSSSDSVSSYEQQWQQLWTEHCNEQYNSCYQAFSSKFNPIIEEKHVTEDNISKFKFSFLQTMEQPASYDIPNLTKEQVEITGLPHRNHSRADTKMMIDSSEEPLEKTVKTRNKGKRRKAKSNTRNQLSSVGYLMKSLNSLSVDQSLSNICDSNEVNVEEVTNLVDKNKDDLNLRLEETTECLNNLNSGMDIVKDSSFSANKIMKQEAKPRSEKNNLKRGHDSDPDDSMLDRVKAAFTLMGFVYKPNSESVNEIPSHIKKAQVVYRKKNIRSQNRALKMPQPRHILFDDNGQPKETLLDKVKNFLGSNGVLETSQSEKLTEAGERLSRLETDDFSEKDDSTDEESFYSAEENRLEEDAPIEKRESLVKLQKKRRKKRMRRSNLPKEIVENEKLLKYWYQRYRLFSKFDNGIKMDAESWYSVTPEKVSKHIAERCRCDIIIDAFCGAGGNAIQFAFTCERVIAIDIDPKKIELARHNASVYGVENRIEFIVGDFLEIGRRLVGDVVFLSPPWGGPQYMLRDSFNLDCVLPPTGGQQLFHIAASISPHIAYYLPKNINTDQLVKLTGPGGAVEIEQNFLDKKLMAVTAYFGELVEPLCTDI